MSMIVNMRPTLNIECYSGFSKTFKEGMYGIAQQREAYTRVPSQTNLINPFFRTLFELGLYIILLLL